MEVSSTSINVASVTVSATAQRFARGFQTVVAGVALAACIGEVWAAALIEDDQYPTWRALGGLPKVMSCGRSQTLRAGKGPFCYTLATHE